MDILINVVNQQLKIATNIRGLVAGTQEFIRLVFNLSSDWDNLMVFAQFIQNGTAYNQYLDDDNCAYVPAEIGAGTCTVMLYGSYNTVIATTNYITLKISDNNLVTDAESTEITSSLYNQLVTKVETLLTFNEQYYADLVDTDVELQQQINALALQADLTAEVTRAKAAEAALQSSLELKASQSEVDSLSLKVTALENDEIIAAAIEEAVASELEAYLTAGTLANMTIADGSISRDKVDSDFEATLVLADSAMQATTYDPQGFKYDIFAFAQAKADTVQTNLDVVKSEIKDAYTLTDTITYTTLGDAVRGAVTLSRSYAQALLLDYEAFTIEIVDTLPTTGESNIFYLLPNSSGGYDKWWWITDSGGTSTWDTFGSSSTEVVTSLPDVGDENVDYVLYSSDGCLYYKYINGVWEVVAGSVAYVSTALPDDGNEYTDYYVLSDSGSYIHYRYINGSFKVIGGDSYTKGEIDTLLSTMEDDVIAELQKDIATNADAIEANATNISSLSQSLDSLSQEVKNLDVEGNSYYETITQNDDGNYVLTLYEVDNTDSTETIVSQNILPATGGGGGTTATTTLTVERITSSPLILTTTDSAIIEINFSSTDSDGEEVDGTYTWKLGSTQIMSGSLVQGLNSFDLTDYVSTGTQKFTLTVTDEGGSTAVKTWTVQMVDVRIESTFSDKTTYTANKTVNFTYTPYGSVSKTVHFILDGVEIGTVTTSSSGTLQSYTLPAQEHGAHLLEVYITATINNVEVETEHIFKDIVWYDSSSTVPVIGCIYRYDYYGTVSARQYDSTTITYYVFDPNTNSPTVTRTADSENVATETLTSTAATWVYKESEIGEHILTISCRATSVEIRFDITDLGIDVSPVTGGLEFDFNPTGLSNNSENRLWVDDDNSDVVMTVSDDFDWSNGGYQIDDDGNQYFCVKAGTRAYFSYNLFSGTATNNISTHGMEFKIVFEVDNVQNIEANWFNCYDDTVGLRLNAHEGYLTSSNSDEDNSNSYLYMPYSEEDIIELEINVNELDDDAAETGSDSYIMSYEDGVGLKAMIYDSSDRLYQYSALPITIGSDECDVHIYRMKAYSNSLTDSNILQNFIADARTSEEMIDRYDRNQIYDENGSLTPDSVAEACPNLRIIKIEAPYFTNDKKDFVKNTTVQCIMKGGDAILDNWTFRNGYHSGQGTTSNEYGYAGRNLDLIFCCDGINDPNDKISADPSYVSTLTLGDGTLYADGTGTITLTRTSVGTNWLNIKVNIASSENANNALLQKRFNDYIPYTSLGQIRNAYVKNDMEFVNCVVFIKETSTDMSAHREFQDNDWHFYAIGNIGDSKKTDYSRAYDQDDINEFTLEVSDNTLNNSTFQSGVYLDDNGNRIIESYSQMTADDAVSHDYVYPITEDEWNENNGRYVTLYADGFDGDDSFELRYGCKGDFKDGKLIVKSDVNNAQLELNANVWRAFYRWVITSTDEEFVKELPEWFIQDSALYWYVYTHHFTMIDNRAKNTFFHFARTGTFRAVAKPVVELLHVYCELDDDGNYTTTTDTEIDSTKTYYTEYAFDMWAYDFDTALGINNSGELTMTYGKEDIDYKTDGDASSGWLFNAATNVFWCRIRDLMPSECNNMYQNIDARCWSASNIISEFDEWQEEFPEELWRLDIERKYLRTYRGEGLNGGATASPTPRFLQSMMQGRKKYQRRQFVRDQQDYFGTKHLTSTVTSDQIMFRCNTPTGSDIVVTPNYTLTIVPYSDMYLSVVFGNTSAKQVRAKAGTAYTVTCPYTTMDDTAVLIYCASKIQSLNDLSACYIHDNDFSKATKLKKLVIGNPTDGYNNSFLTTLNMGDNVLLEELDLRNCGSLAGSLNLSSCANLITLYAEGTAIRSVTFATNGKIVTAHLPGTINSLIMRYLNYLTDLQVESWDNLETLTIYSGIVDMLGIVEETYDTVQTLTLYGIDWTLGSTDLLNSILGMNSSTLSGSVYVSGAIRNQEILNYATAWPDLEVTYDAANLVQQYLVTYQNADGTVLYEVYIDRGSTPIDPVELGYISTPTMESTAQYVYTYSGWDDLTSSILVATTITAQYTTTTRKYTVTWYSRAGVSLGSQTAEYGTEVVYSGSTPTRTDEESTYVYNLFTGWDKSTGYITGDIDVYAVWDRGEYPATGTDIADMSTAQIYGLTVRNNNVAPTSSSNIMSNFCEAKDRITINMGRDYTFDNVESHTLVEMGNDLILDGTDATVKEYEYKLCDSEDKGFTFMIDYEFTEAITNGTLFSCFDYDGYAGIRLRYNTNPNLQWGNVNTNVGGTRFRNVLVVRKQPNSSRIYYYTFNGTGTNGYFTDATTNGASTRSTDYVTDMPVILGAIKYSDTGTYDYYGKGVIHFCKIWMADLGATVAADMVKWFRTPMVFEYIDTGLYRQASNNSLYTNASFICAEETLYLMQMNTSNDNTGGWDACKMRQWLNPTYNLYTESYSTDYDGYSRMFDAFPIEWQTIIKRTRIPANHGYADQTTVLSYDYLYLPSFKEMANTSTTVLADEGTYISWFTSDILRAKFRGRLVPETASYYQTETDPADNGYTPVVGDVWKYNGGTCYIYIDDEEIAKYNMDNSTSLPGYYSYLACSAGGGWRTASNWWGRSAYLSNSTNFYSVSYYGYAGNYNYASNWCAVVPCFSI